MARKSAEQLRHQRRNSALRRKLELSKSKIAGAPIGKVQSDLQVFIEDEIITTEWFQLLLSIFTVFVLFGDSCRALVVDSTKWEVIDMCFFVTFLVSFILFNLEIILQTYSIPGYFYWNKRFQMTRWQQIKTGDFPKASFYCLLDFIATYSLLFEIISFDNDLDFLAPSPMYLNLGNVNITSSYYIHINNNQEHNNLQHQNSVEITSGAASLYLVLRVSRMVRLFRIAKIFKSFEYFMEQDHHQIKPRSSSAAKWVSVHDNEKTHGSAVTNNAVDDDENHNVSEEEEEESQFEVDAYIGRSIAEITLKKTTIGGLIILMALPVLEYPVINNFSQNSAQFSHSFFSKVQLCYNNHMGVSLSSIEEEMCEFISEGANVANNEILSPPKKHSYGIELLAMKQSVSMGPKVRICNSSSGTPCSYSNNTSIVQEPTSGIDSIDHIYRNRKGSLQITILDSDNIASGLHFKTVAYWDLSELNANDGFRNMLITVCIMVILGIGTMAFAFGIMEIVLQPIKILLDRVDEISNSPLNPIIQTKLPDDPMETELLLGTIEKIGTLLRIGFGEAGAQIIAENLAAENHELRVKNMLKGREVVSIFGFSDIRNFTDTTECLQGEVMAFVNRIAHILHKVIKDCGGHTNKNIGDAFLITWKVPNTCCDPSTGIVFPSEASRELFDKALFAFLSITMQLRKHEAFINRFPKKEKKRLWLRFPNYQVALGMGLHVGKGFEGAIGSKSKIDVTYISEHVNHVEFLESSTKPYKVSLLMSHFFRDQLSREAKDMCRYIDTAKITENLSFDLWTFDVVQLDQLKSKRLRIRIRNFNSNTDEDDLDRESPLQTKLTKKANIKEDSITANHPSIEEGKRIVREQGVSVAGEKAARFLGMSIDETTPSIQVKFEKSSWNTDINLHRLQVCITNSLRKLWPICTGLYKTEQWVECLDKLIQFQTAHIHINGCEDGPATYLIRKVQDEIKRKQELSGMC